MLENIFVHHTNIFFPHAGLSRKINILKMRLDFNVSLSRSGCDESVHFLCGRRSIYLAVFICLSKLKS